MRRDWSKPWRSTFGSRDEGEGDIVLAVVNVAIFVYDRFLAKEPCTIT